MPRADQQQGPDSEHSLGILPDYSKSMEQLYWEVVLKIFEYQENLKAMLYCRLGPETSRNAYLPTWVPNWQFKGSYMAGHNNSYFGSVNTACQYRQEGIDELVVTGVEVAIIAETSPVLEKLPSESLVVTCKRLIRTIAPEDIESGAYVGGGSPLDAFAKTLQMNIIAEISHPPDNFYSSMESILSAVRKILSATEENLCLDESQNESQRKCSTPRSRT